MKMNIPGMLVAGNNVLLLLVVRKLISSWCSDGK